MDRDETRAVGDHLLDEARALRAAFPDTAAMRAVTVTALSAGPAGGETSAYRAALGYLWDEMRRVRAGRAHDLIVLDDEIACVERLTPRG